MTVPSVSLAYQVLDLQARCDRQAAELAWYREDHGLAPAAALITKTRRLEVQVYQLREALEEIVALAGEHPAGEIAARALADTPGYLQPGRCVVHGADL